MKTPTTKLTAKLFLVGNNTPNHLSANNDYDVGWSHSLGKGLVV